METAILIIEILGVISFSISGALVAIDKETDIFGVVFLAAITTFGGGIMRDIIIGRIPAFFVSMPLYVVISIVTSLTVFFIAMIFKKQYVREEKLVEYINDFADAAGIAIFAVSSVRICLDFIPGCGAFLAIMMGMVSSIGGGMTRDMILREIPFVLRKRIYALAVIAGSAVYYLSAVHIFKDSAMCEIISVILGFITCFAIRLLAIRFKWNMPKAIKFSEISTEKVEPEEQNDAENCAVYTNAEE